MRTLLGLVLVTLALLTVSTAGGCTNAVDDVYIAQDLATADRAVDAACAADGGCRD